MLRSSVLLIFEQRKDRSVQRIDKLELRQIHGPCLQLDLCKNKSPVHIVFFVRDSVLFAFHENASCASYNAFVFMEISIVTFHSRHEYLIHKER
jgi:hypothetical protein